MTTRWFAFTACAAVAAALGISPALAGATTICVPGFSAQCPDANGNVAKADLEEAMSFQAADGKADTIFVGAGTFTESDDFEPEAGSSKTSFEVGGSDPLTIVGAGPGATVLTSTSTANEYLFNLASNNSRSITVRDLTLQLPASYPDGGGKGYGAGVYLANGDVLDNVDIVSLNPESNPTSALGFNNVFRNGELRGSGGGSVGNGFAATNPSSSLLVEDSVARGASWAVYGGGGGSVTARRVAVIDARTYGAIASGGSVTVENSTMTIDDGIGLYASASAANASLTADHVTIVNTGAGDPALEARKSNPDAGNVTMTVANSILRGFETGYEAETPIGPGIGLVKITARYSNLLQNGTLNGGAVDFGTGNIDADPLLTADFSLPPGSPAVDAGDPSLGLNADFLGAPRPVDGNGDGLAIRDQGAFEYQRPAVPVPGSGSGDGAEPDKAKPKVQGLKGPGKALAGGRAKFRFRANEARSRFVCKLDGRKAAGCKSPKSYSGLKPGRHSFKVWAIDPAGNKSAKPAKKVFRVPAA